MKSLQCNSVTRSVCVYQCKFIGVGTETVFLNMHVYLCQNLSLSLKCLHAIRQYRYIVNSVISFSYFATLMQ